MEEIIHDQHPPSTNDLSAAILRTLAYFDIFKHPLTAQEIAECCDYAETNLAQVEEALTGLSGAGWIWQDGLYYALSAKSSVQKRLESAVRCEQYLHQAYRYSRLIARFPFVRGVCISGSLSKGCADEQADVDYFIIAEAGRLWVCRTLLTLFKKTMLLNSHKYFCLNYFVDNEHLEIPDQNIFTATEIVFLLPTYAYSSYAAFLKANAWTANWFPNKPLREADLAYEAADHWSKHWLEKVFAGRLGNLLETFCLRLTRHYRRRKFDQMDKNEFEHAMRATRSASKHHPNSFQNRVVEAYKRNLDDLRDTFGLQLI
jgi:hypothetical protein